MIDFLLSLDRTFFLFLNGLNATWLNLVMSILSGQVVWLPFVAYALWSVYKAGNRTYFWVFCLFLILTLAASDVSSSYLLKNIFQRMRPCRLDELRPLINQFGQKCGGKYGFVSSHAANTMALFFFFHASLKMKGKWSLLLFLAPLLVGLSRVYLGVHYPGDVIGGWLVGIMCALFTSWALKNLRCKSAN